VERPQLIEDGVAALAQDGPWNPRNEAAARDTRIAQRIPHQDQNEAGDRVAALSQPAEGSTVARGEGSRIARDPRIIAKRAAGGERAVGLMRIEGEARRIEAVR